MYNNTPQSSSSNNLLMVNNAYSPYMHHGQNGYGYHNNDHSGSFRSNGSRMSNISSASGNYNVNEQLQSNHSNRSLSLSPSPYRSQLEAYNEYCRRNSRNNRNSGMTQSPSSISMSINGNHKMYHIQKNGHEIVYQNK